MILQIFFYLGDHLGIVRAVFIQPEYGRSVAKTGTVYGQLHPILYRGILGLAHTPDITLFHGMLKQHSAAGVDDLNGTGSRNLKGFVVRTVFFGLLRHQTYVWYAAHGARIESTVFFTELNGFLIHAGVATIRNHGFGVVQATVDAPDLTGRTDHRRHRRVDNYVVGEMQVGNTLIRVHHAQRRTLG